MTDSKARQTDRSPSPRADVCVIGSGPAGALVAASLARRGHTTVVLEAGPRFDFQDRLQRMETHLRSGHNFLDVWEMGGKRDRYSNQGEITYPLNRRRVKGVGGSTLHWGGRLERLYEKDFEMESRYGLADDWPISYDDIQPYYAQAENEVGAAGPGQGENPFAPPRAEDPPMGAFPPSYSDRLFAEACEKIDITVHRVLNARNIEPYDGRSQCQGFGTCSPVCPSGAQYSADVHIRKAEQHGARVLDRVPVQRLEHDPEGERIEAGVYVTPDGDEYRQEARQFVLACGGVETPRLLLLSRSEQYPNGLANSSGLVGHYFEERPIATVMARVDRRTRQHLIGFGTSESHQFYDYDDAPPGSIKLEFGNIHGPSPIHLALQEPDLLNTMRNVAVSPGDFDAWSGLQQSVLGGQEWGDDLLESIRDGFGNYLGMSAAVETLPRRENRVTLDTSHTDDHGNPVPEIHWSPDPFAEKTMDRAFEIMDRIMDNLNANILSRGRLRWWKGIGHHIGTTRMGTDPTESVVDARLRTHDLRNLFIASSSVFVTGGAMQPTLTIAALALRVADHVHEAL